MDDYGLNVFSFVIEEVTLQFLRWLELPYVSVGQRWLSSALVFLSQVLQNALE